MIAARWQSIGSQEGKSGSYADPSTANIEQW